MKHLKKISVLAAEIKDGKLRLDYSEMSMVMIFEQSK